MMSVSRQLFAFLCLFALCFGSISFVNAQEEELISEDAPAVEVDTDSEYVEEVAVEDEPQRYVMPAADVQTYVKFIGVEGTKFIAGDEVTALIGMHNSGDKTYNVSYVGAHLHSPFDYNFYVQNFTVRWTSNLLPPRSEVTVEYRFRPDPNLEPLDFQLSGWLIYNDSAPTPVIYRSMFVNQTIEVLERRQEWTASSIITWIFVLAGLGLAGYVALNLTQGGKKTKSRASTPSVDGVKSPSAGWETQVYKPAQVQKAFGSKKEKKAAPKAQ